jgi:nucleoside-diphosphate-sugar epimerase
VKLFVTGGTGFLGSHLLARLHSDGVPVTACRRRVSSARLEVPNSASWITKPMEEIDVGELEGHDALVHLAAYGVSPQPCSWNEAFRFNVQASLGLLQKAKEAGIPRVVVAGSCHEYGLSANHYDFIPADAPMKPMGAYGASKAAFSVAAAGYARATNWDIRVLRIFAVYGEGQNPGNFWPSLKRAAMAGEDFQMTLGEQICDFSPVEFVVDEILAEVIKPGSNRVFRNLGSGQPQSLLDFATGWWSKWNAKGRLLAGSVAYRKNEIMRYVPLLEM